ncbi:TAF11 [Candida margitis]|uniref:TAF11 n=1 Tax=Candida margitis TaxID=1775924 RepID=UPI00222657AC|nr:TAF11 [Candida margitis]KAI5950046.1 TAF11 [Candida margitis]
MNHNTHNDYDTSASILSNEDALSDISLDEEDEELIWRVFFSDLEKHTNRQKQSESIDEEPADAEEIDSDNEELFSISSEDLLSLGDPALADRYKDLKSNAIDVNLSEEEQKRLLITNFTNDQMERFEAYRRSTINKPGVKKICNGVVGHSVSQVIATVVAGVAKSFISEIISKSFEVQDRDNKGTLLSDIEKKKNQKRSDIENIQTESETKPAPLSYQGDHSSPLQPTHIREALRLYQDECSGELPS